MPVKESAVAAVAAACLALASSCQAALAQAQSAAPNPARIAKKYGEAGGWAVSGVSVEGLHMACSIAPLGEAGAKAAFELSSEGLTVLVATAAKGAEGDEVKGAYEIDGKATGLTFSRVANARMLAFVKTPQARQLRAGKAKSMTLTIGPEKTVVPLAGVDAALKKAAECNDKGGA